MDTGTDLSPLFNLRKNFTVIALTGRSQSGYHKIGKLLETGFVDANYPDPKNFSLENNSYKKYKILFKYAKENFKPFILIRYSDILTLVIIQNSFENLRNYLTSHELISFLSNSKVRINDNFDDEITNLIKLESLFKHYTEYLKEISFDNSILIDEENAVKFCNLFLSDEFKNFSKELHLALKKSNVKYALLLESISYNIRETGHPYKTDNLHPDKILTIAIFINSIIKLIRKNNGTKPTRIVIDSLKNPFEINYFKQRFSAFYVVAVNMDDKIREAQLKRKYSEEEFTDMKIILEDEYIGGKGKEFYKKYVRECIEKADIHITNRTDNKTEELNSNKVSSDKTSPYFTVGMQLLKYISLIQHPGLVTPSPEERCMQLAYTAKYNSGCISRQVGATVTDEFYSVKSIGWNNTPEGQVPCSMRDVEVLLNASDEFIGKEMKNERHNEKKISSNTTYVLEPIDAELKSFTPYEKTNKKFKEALQKNFSDQINLNRNLLDGRTVCFCFKSLQNSCSEGKNQVHTRSLHAEESAFLQITKYGGTGLKNGKLFTTASPCELCSKKAYQIGIKVIYYVDPYPGISQEQVLGTGSKKPELRLFNGAIGNAYHWLYEPFMAYKDELAIILGQDIKDKLSQLEEELKTARERIKELEKI